MSWIYFFNAVFRTNSKFEKKITLFISFIISVLPHRIYTNIDIFGHKNFVIAVTHGGFESNHLTNIKLLSSPSKKEEIIKYQSFVVIKNKK